LRNARADSDIGISTLFWIERGSHDWNGHYACTCYHPLFVFNQFGDLERSELRPGNVHSANGWDGVLKPVVAAPLGQGLMYLFPGGRSLCQSRCHQSRCLRVSRSRADQVCDPHSNQSGPPGQDQLSAQAPGLATPGPIKDWSLTIAVLMCSTATDRRSASECQAKK
jgi:Transposase DDE domain group 1